MNRKQLERAVVFMNMFTNPAISIDVLNEKYNLKLTDDTSNEDALQEFLKIEEITFDEVEIPKIKTLEEFESSDKWEDLIGYLGDKPCQIDEDLCYHIQCAYVASNYIGIIKDGHCTAQNGEAEYSFDDGYNKRYTYMTVVSYPDNTHWYLGILPDLSRE